MQCAALTSPASGASLTNHFAVLLKMLTLILGGARSGKSRYAQSLCGNAPDVVYVGTARAEGDEEMSARISRHQADRSRKWKTVEEPLDVTRIVLETTPLTALILVDCITVWLANLAWEHRTLPDKERESVILERVAGFAEAARKREVIAVSNEVGSGIVPDNPVGRSFRDLQGLANQLLAREAQRVTLAVAGLPLTLKDQSQ